MASVKGGACHCAAASLGEPFYDDDSKLFWEKEETKQLTQTTKPLSDFKGTDFDCVFYVGGYGTMSDFPNAPDVARVGSEVYVSGGHVAAVCHGQSALLNMTLPDGQHLVKGKTVVSFTNEEEAAMGHPKLPTPGTQEDMLTALGADFSKGEPWSCTIRSSERLHTGQNPASAGALGAAIVSAMQ